MQVISWLTCDFYLVVASGIQLSLRFCSSVQQVSHVLSLSFPNVNREQPILNLLLRQRGWGCWLWVVQPWGAGGTSLSGVTPQRGPSATAALCWQGRWEWETNTLLEWFLQVPRGHPGGFGVWLPLSSSPAWKRWSCRRHWVGRTSASNFLLYSGQISVEKITSIRPKWFFVQQQQQRRVQQQGGRVGTI